LPAGGAEEAAVRLARCFAAKLILSSGGALWSPAVESSPSPSSQVLGSIEFVNPSPALVWQSIRSSLKKEEVMWCLAMEMVVQGVGSLELATGDFPSTEGMYLIQAIKGPPLRHRRHLVHHRHRDLEGFGVIFSFY
jgi:hypothetical protein